MLFQFVVPYVRTVNVFQVYPLSMLLSVVEGIPLVGQHWKVVKVMLHRQSDILLLREIAGLLDCSIRLISGPAPIVKERRTLLAHIISQPLRRKNPRVESLMISVDDKRLASDNNM